MSNATLMASDVPGIGAVTARALSAHGFDSAKALAAASVEALSAVPGFGPARAARVKEAAAQALAGGGVVRRKTPAARKTVARKPTTRTRAKPAQATAASAAKTAAATPEATESKPGKTPAKAGKAKNKQDKKKSKKDRKKDKGKKSRKDKGRKSRKDKSKKSAK